MNLAILQYVYAVTPADVFGRSDLSAIGFWNWVESLKRDKGKAKSTYRKLMRHWHPDVNDSANATEVSKSLTIGFSELI